MTRTARSCIKHVRREFKNIRLGCQSRSYQHDDGTDKVHLYDLTPTLIMLRWCTNECIGSCTEQRQTSGRYGGIHLDDEEEAVDAKASVNREFDFSTVLKDVLDLKGLFI